MSYQSILNFFHKAMAMRNPCDHSQMMSALSLRNLKVREVTSWEGQGLILPPYPPLCPYRITLPFICFEGSGKGLGKTFPTHAPPNSMSPGDIKQEGVGAFREGPPYQRRGALQLWQFLVALLDDPTNAHFIAWTGRGMEFKLIEPEEVGFRFPHLSLPTTLELGDE